MNIKRHILLLTVILCALAARVTAHPHVFVDGGLDFVVTDQATLTALEVTWLFDEFETLYLLSSAKLMLTEEGQLPPGAWAALRSNIGAWPDSFSGSAHLSVAGHAIGLDDPAGFGVRMVDTRLELTFTRALSEPVTLHDARLEAAFYEATYFYDFSITQLPTFIGDADGCAADVIPFTPDDELVGLRSALQALGREEMPETTNVGALFADRIMVRCA